MLFETKQVPIKTRLPNAIFSTKSNNNVCRPPGRFAYTILSRCVNSFTHRGSYVSDKKGEKRKTEKIQK